MQAQAVLKAMDTANKAAAELTAARKRLWRASEIVADASEEDLATQQKIALGEDVICLKYAPDYLKQQLTLKLSCYTSVVNAYAGYGYAKDKMFAVVGPPKFCLRQNLNAMHSSSEDADATGAPVFEAVFEDVAEEVEEEDEEAVEEAEDDEEEAEEAVEEAEDDDDEAEEADEEAEEEEEEADEEAVEDDEKAVEDDEEAVEDDEEAEEAEEDDEKAEEAEEEAEEDEEVIIIADAEVVIIINDDDEPPAKRHCGACFY